MGTFQKFCLRWNNHTTNLLGTLGHILSSEQHTDVTLCCQGEVWRLHKLVLCASSSHFEKLLAALPPGHSPIVVLDGPHPQDVASLIHFIYHGEVNVDQENLASLLRTAESLKIKGLAEVSSVTSSTNEHKHQSDGESQRLANRGRMRPGSCQSNPIYTLGNEYAVGMYGLVTQAISPQTQIVPEQIERDPSPLNLSFSGTLKNIHDETPQERQERRNRLDNLLYAATERSKKEERREARREAREAAIREAAAMRDAVIVSQDSSVLPPVPKRIRICEGSRNTTLPAHPAFHIPLMNLTVPPGTSDSFVTSHSNTATQSQHTVYETPHVEAHPIPPHQDPSQDYQEIEVVSTNPPIKRECADVASEANIVVEEVALNSDESDTQSAPETPSDLSTTGNTCSSTPVPTCTTAATQVSLSTPCAIDDVTSSSACTTPASITTLTSATNTITASPSTESGEEKVAPYFHSILRQVAEGNNNGEPVSTNAQRVTINMRTFKEEWRRQLLVDYDTRTNMSICMLCFTTFKSYDGPRKNTYVKHAKRFHPSLEEYSEEERDLIINMYEKYHKYDVDMQKEFNKSYRTANAIAALGKKGAKHTEVTSDVISSASIKSDTTDGELQDAKKTTENISPTQEEDSQTTADENRSHSPESDLVVTDGSEKDGENVEVVNPKEKVNNNNVPTTPQVKRSQMNTRTKAVAPTTVSV